MAMREWKHDWKNKGEMGRMRQMYGEIPKGPWDEEPDKVQFVSCGLDCLLHINEHICPRFVLELFRQVELVHNEDHTLSLWFWV